MSEFGRRLLRHLPEVAAAAVAISTLAATGFELEVPAWVLLAVVFGAAVVFSAAATVWRGVDRGWPLHLRLACQTAAVTAAAYTTGWGALLGMAGYLFTITDNVAHAGSRTVRPALVWSLGAAGAAQLGVATGTLPSAVPADVAHSIAVVTALVVVLVGLRLEATARSKERAEAEVRAREQRFRNLVQHSSDAIVVIAGDGRVTYASPSTERVLGYTETEALGVRYLDLIHPDDQPRVLAAVRELAAEPGRVGLIECRTLHRDGRWLVVESNCHNLLHDPDVAGFVLNTRDITERKQLEAELAYRAFHDTLTGLANRALFFDRVAHTVARAARSRQRFAVLLLDLDGFKSINDTLGHAVGDEVLVAVADTLRTTVRDADTAARLGGDEFALLLDDIRDAAGAARVAERLLAALRRPRPIGPTTLRLDASIGIAIGDGAQDAETLLRHADIAMYMAKREGKGGYELFEPHMHVQVTERLRFEAELQRALEQDQFRLHYQPIVELDTGRVVGVEALLRWQHPERGLVPPGEFIPVAEETGLIVPIGRWVIRAATRQLRRWLDETPSDRGLYVSVNVSGRHVACGTLLDDVAGPLSEAGLEGRHLVVELTESAVLDDRERAAEVLRGLRELGVRVAIDDFGTGYSSLGYLHRLPVDVLKIDRSFIDGLTRGTVSTAVVRAIVELGRSLELETVAEGIEHDEQLTRFRALRCRLGQGYLLARPGPPEAIVPLLSGATPAAEGVRLPRPPVRRAGPR